VEEDVGGLEVVVDNAVLLQVPVAVTQDEHTCFACAQVTRLFVYILAVRAHCDIVISHSSNPLRGVAVLSWCVARRRLKSSGENVLDAGEYLHHDAACVLLRHGCARLQVPKIVLVCACVCM
jgi:hypothetical protein